MSSLGASSGEESLGMGLEKVSVAGEAARPEDTEARRGSRVYKGRAGSGSVRAWKGVASRWVKVGEASPF